MPSNKCTKQANMDLLRVSPLGLDAYVLCVHLHRPLVNDRMRFDPLLVAKTILYLVTRQTEVVAREQQRRRQTCAST